MALEIDLRTLMATSCFFKSVLALSGAFLSYVRWKVSRERENAQDELEQFEDCRLRSLSDSTVGILKTGDQAGYICAEPQTVRFSHLQGGIRQGESNRRMELTLQSQIRLISRALAFLPTRAVPST